MFCTACGEYNHWRKDCPYNCHCDNCDSDSHATHMCRAPPKPSPTPSPQPVFVFTVVIQIIGQWSAVTTLEITGRKDMHPAQHQTSTTKRNNEKSTLTSSKNLQKSNGKSRNNDKPRTSGKNPQKPETGRQHHQQPQHPTQGKHNHNSFPYRNYRYHEQLRQTRFNKKQNQLYSPYHFAPSPALSAGSDMLSHSIMQLAKNSITFT